MNLTLKFRDGETVDDFGIRINRIANQLAVLRDAVREEEVVRKFLQALPPKFEQIASSIETLLDLGDLSMEELIGRLKATEERHNFGGTGSVASLNLTEDKLVARISSRLHLNGSGNNNSGGSKVASGGWERSKGSPSSHKQRRGRGRGNTSGGCGGGKGGQRGGAPPATNAGTAATRATLGSRMSQEET